MLQRGLMMDRPLLISSILEHAEAQHGRMGRIVSRETHGPVFRYTFAQCAARVKKLGERPRRTSGCRPAATVGSLGLEQSPSR